MTWNSIIDYIMSVGGIIAPLTAILGFGYKYLLEPWERKKAREEDLARRERLQQDKEYQDKMLDITKSQMEPIVKMLEEFKDVTIESKNDRQKLTEIAERNMESIKNHEDRLDDHGDRILILETQRGISNGHHVVTYKEKYGRKEEK